jgi:urocanate hydratase
VRIIKVRPKEVHVFHAATKRSNIAYSVFEHDPDVDETDAVCRLVRDKLDQYLAPSKLIVYGGTIKRAKSLSQASDCHKYYHEVGD